MDTITNPPLFPVFEVPEEVTPAEPPPAEPGRYQHIPVTVEE